MALGLKLKNRIKVVEMEVLLIIGIMAALTLLVYGLIYKFAKSVYEACKEPPAPIARLKFAYIYIFIYGPLFILNQNYFQSAAIFPLHVICMVAFIYIPYFICKTLTALEKENDIKSSCTACTLFLVAMLPVGIFVAYSRYRKVAGYS